MRLRVAPFALMLVGPLTGCGDDGSPSPDADVDAVRDAAPDAPAVDAGERDAAVADGGGPPTAQPCPSEPEPGELMTDIDRELIVVRGTVFAGALPPRESGEPRLDPVERGADDQIVGATVSVRDADGTVISRGQTNADGCYALPAPAATPVVFIQVHPIDGPAGGYPGFIEARATSRDDLLHWDIWLLLTHELQWRMDMLGRDYDPSTGWVVQSFASPRRAGGGLEGGHGVELTGASHGPTFAVTAIETIETNQLPPECEDGTATEHGLEPGEPLLADDGEVVCYTDLLEMLFISEVEPTTEAQLELLDPPGMGCEQTQRAEQWLVEADSVTRARAECAPLD